MFPIYDPVQSGLKAASGVGDILSGIIANRAAKENLAALPQQIKDDLAMRGAQLSMAQDQAKYTPNLLQAQLTGSNLANQGTSISNQMNQQNLAAHPEQIAQSLLAGKLQNALNQLKVNYYPETIQTNALNAASRSSMAQQSPISGFIRAVNTPFMQSVLSNNPNAASAVMNVINNLYNRSVGAGVPASSPMSTVQSGMQSGTSIQNMPSQVGGQQINASQPQQLPQIGASPFSISQDQLQQGMQATGAALQKRTSDANTRKQALNAQNLMQEVDKIDISPLEKYSGIGGALSQKMEQLKGLAGQNQDPDYVKYVAFKKNVVPQIADTLRQTLQTSVVPEYVKQMIVPLTDPQNSIYDNPQIIRERWNTFNTWLKEYTKQRTEAVNYGVPNVQGQYANLGQSTQSNQINIPSSFKSQEEKKAWINSLTPEQKEQVKRQLAG